MLVNYLPMIGANLKYSNREMARMDEVALFIFLESLHKYWFIEHGTDILMKGHALIYNSYHNDDKNKFLNVDELMEIINKLKIKDNRPSKPELVHTYNVIGITRAKTAKRVHLREDNVKKHLQSPNPFKYLPETRVKNLDNFLRWILDQNLYTISLFNGYVNVSGYIPRETIKSWAPVGLSDEEREKWVSKKYMRIRETYNARVAQDKMRLDKKIRRKKRSKKLKNNS